MRAVGGHVPKQDKSESLSKLPGLEARFAVLLKSPDLTIEEMFGAGYGDAGLDHDEFRSWVGWHHHMTLSLMTPLFLCVE